jgi:two-component system, NtrC family, nitrogen regulation sensor histidine kinase NtrY
MIFSGLNRLHLSLSARLLAITMMAIIAASLCGYMVYRQWQAPELALLVSLLSGLSIGFALTLALTRHLHRSLGAIEQGMLNLLDSDFSISLAASKFEELNRIIQHYNHLVNHLRVERQSIFQRELLLNTVIENSSMCVLITDQNARIIYSNHIAENLLHNDKAVRGMLLRDLLDPSPTLLNAIEREQSGIFQLIAQSERLHYLSCGRFTLNSQHHTLILIKEMTREINRQEAATWKKVIQVISHELNNSLAPISSLAHSGQLMLDMGKHAELPDVFTTLAERAGHLKNFVGGYAEIAKLPRPQKSTVDWQKFFQSLTRGYPFVLRGKLPETPGHFDAGQIHQTLLNLLKNAKQSGSDSEHISLHIHQTDTASVIEVADRGTGMSPEILHSALLPFYSTKPTGSGIGLALCREIVEAHEGHISLANRNSGGLRVTMTLPLQ